MMVGEGELPTLKDYGRKDKRLIYSQKYDIISGIMVQKKQTKPIFLFLP